MNRRSFNAKKWALVYVIIGFALTACSVSEAQTSESSCDWVNAGTGPDFSAETCTEDPQSCAVAINKCLADFSFADSDKWWLFETAQGLRQNVASPRHINHITPQHGRYVSVYVNQIAQVALQDILDMPVAPQQVSLPHGAIVVKLNYSGPDAQPSPPWLTAMIKIDGYCPKTVGGNCDGGDWFYYLNRFGNFLSFEELNDVNTLGITVEGERAAAVGSPDTFCTSCHNPVERTDFLWTLDSALWKTAPATLPGAILQGTAGNHAFASATPDDLCVAGTLTLSADLPNDVPINPDFLSDPTKAQAMFDCYSWRSFIALNWAANPDERGQPATEVPFDGKGAERVWESYKETFEVFQPSDPDWTVTPDQWNERPAVPEACLRVVAELDDETRRALRADTPKSLQMVTKTRNNDVLNETHQAFGNQFNILIDQDGRLIRYEVRFNRDEFQYLAENGYANTGNYSYSGPKGVTDFAFPTNVDGNTGVGAIEIKAAWRELCSGPVCTEAEDEQAKRYYVIPALKFTPGTSNGSRQDKCSLIGKAGLIGMHVARKTQFVPQWTWSTFEHVDNVPPVKGNILENWWELGHVFLSDQLNRLLHADAPGVDVDYTLFSPKCELPDFKPSELACSSQRPGVLPASKRPDFSSNRAECCANLQLLRNTHPKAVQAAISATPVGQTSQPLLRNHVTRLDPIGPKALNARVADLIRNQSPNNPFQYYVLVNTQWPRGTREPETGKVASLSCFQRDVVDRQDTPCYTIMPRKGNDSLRLRNTSMETFQVSVDDGPEAEVQHYSSAGCLNCHGDTGVDFSFVFTDGAEISTPLPESQAGINNF